MIGIDAEKLTGGTELEAPRLALKPREAAKALGISERLLWTWTKEGIVSHVKIGGRVLYLVDRLKEDMSSLTEKKKAT